MRPFKEKCLFTHANLIRKCIVRHNERYTAVVGYAG